MCHIICIKPYHHTVSKFHHFFLSKMFMRIHFFFVISQNRLEESDFYQAQDSSPRSHERMNMDLPTTSNISGTHMEVFIFEVLSNTLQIHVHVYYNKFLVLVKNKPLLFIHIFSFLSIFNLILPVLQLNFH